MSTTRKSLNELSVSTKRLKTLSAKQDADIDYSDIGELDSNFWENAEVREPANKERLTVRFDADIVQWFKQQGRGYQTRMNSVLRAYYEAQKDR